VSSSTQYQLLRSPRSNPMVSFCREIFLLCFVAAVLTFFIAGILFICALSTSITWERTPHPVRRPAFSSHLFAAVLLPSKHAWPFIDCSESENIQYVIRADGNPLVSVHGEGDRI